MSAAHLEQMFLAPLDFLKMNLLCLSGPLPTLRGVYHFSYEPAVGTFCQRRPGFLARERYPTRVWHVRLVPRGARNGVPAFFLPDGPGQTLRGILPRDVQFMLGGSQAGSVFGVARYRQGAVEVCQAHHADGDDRMGRETAWCGARLAGEGALATTILGVNNPRLGWQFHAQRWERRNALLLHYQDLITL
jgi:hypothetical protein